MEAQAPAKNMSEFTEDRGEWTSELFIHCEKVCDDEGEKEEVQLQRIAHHNNVGNKTLLGRWPKGGDHC